MAIDPTQVKRYAHGSRVPGWDSAVDLTKDPAVVPDPATTYVPDHVRAAIEALMAKYPDLRSAAIPAMKIVQREHGWLSPTAMEQAACVLRLRPRTWCAWRASTTCSSSPRRARPTSTSARTSAARSSAPTRCTRG